MNDRDYQQHIEQLLDDERMQIEQYDNQQQLMEQENDTKHR